MPNEKYIHVQDYLEINLIEHRAKLLHVLERTVGGKCPRPIYVLFDVL